MRSLVIRETSIGRTVVTISNQKLLELIVAEIRDKCPECPDHPDIFGLGSATKEIVVSFK